MPSARLYSFLLKTAMCRRHRRLEVLGFCCIRYMFRVGVIFSITKADVSTRATYFYGIDSHDATSHMITYVNQCLPANTVPGIWRLRMGHGAAPPRSCTVQYFCRRRHDATSVSAATMLVSFGSSPNLMSHCTVFELL